jgi:hypothetical protein
MESQTQWTKKLFLFLGAVVILFIMFWFFTENILLPKINSEMSVLKNENNSLRSELTEVKQELASKAKEDSLIAVGVSQIHKAQIASIKKNPHNQLLEQLFNHSNLDLTSLSDYGLEQDRIALCKNLKTLALKAQAYYNTSRSNGGGDRSFAGLDSSSWSIEIASHLFMDNGSGTYSIKGIGNVNNVVFHAVGRFPLSDRTYPIYECQVTSSGYQINKLN